MLECQVLQKTLRTTLRMDKSQSPDRDPTPELPSELAPETAQNTSHGDERSSVAELSVLRSRLEASRNDLLALHQVLLQAERVRYEKVFGRISGNGVFLQLALHDPWFTWLRPMMRLVSEIDTRLSDDPPLTRDEAEGLLTQARTLLSPDTEGSGFQKEFQQLLQDSPDVAVLHRQLVRGRAP